MGGTTVLLRDLRDRTIYVVGVIVQQVERASHGRRQPIQRTVAALLSLAGGVKSEERGGFCVLATRPVE